MDWPRPQPESSYLWDQVSQLRCYLYDPTSSHVSTSLALLLPARFFLVSRSPPSSHRSPCHSLALFLRSYSLSVLYFASSFHFHPVPRYLSSALLLCTLYSPGPLFSLLAGRTFCFSLKVTRPPAARRCFLVCQIVVRLYSRNRHRGFVSLRAFDRTPDSTAMMRENHKRLLLSRCMIYHFNGHQAFQLRGLSLRDEKIHRF